jgi:autotransporter-associated beta strand protein
MRKKYFLYIFCVYCILFIQNVKAQETYLTQTTNLNATHTINTNSNYFAGNFNNGIELGTFANGNGNPFPGNPGVACFRTFTIDGANPSATARPLQLGDQFTITGFVGNSSSFFGGSNAGISFNASTNNTAFSDYLTNSRLRLQINQNGNWFINVASGALGFSTPGSDASITFKMNTPNIVTVTIAGTNGATTQDVVLDNTGSIDSFVIWNQTSGNSNDMIWKNASLTATGQIDLGGSNSSFTVPEVLTDGLLADSNVTPQVNNLTKNGSGNVTLTGNNTYTGTTTINSGSLIIGNGGTSGTLGTGAVTNNANLTFNRSDNLTLANAISGTGDLIKQGTGDLTVTGTNSYSGNTLIEAGSVTTSGTGNLGNGTDVLISSSAELIVNNDITVASIQERGTSNGGTVEILSGGTLTLNGNNKGAIFQNSLNGSGNLIIETTGTTEHNLYGVNGLTGTTTVREGTLKLLSSLADSDVTVEAGGTLIIEGSSQITVKSINIQSGGTLQINGNQSLRVTGGFINNGTVNLSSTSGGDLILEGNLNDNGVFNANSRAVFFQGNATQTINSTTNPLDIDVMRIDKSGGEVVMAQNLLLDQTNDPLEFNNNTSFLNLSNFTLTIGNDGTASNITYNGGAFRGTTGSILTIEGDGTLGGGLVFDPAFDDLGTLNISRANNGLVTVNSNLDVTGNINISQGTLELSAADNLNGNLVLSGGNFSTGATTGHTETLGTLNVQASGAINLGSGAHSLNFANSSAVAWDGAAVLTINDWTGTAGASGAGTAGSINVGAGGLSAGQLAAIQFTGYPQGAVLTGSGEVVPELELIPVSPATVMTFTNISRTQMTIGWTNGSGNNRIVVVRANNAVDFNPLNGTDYAANTDFMAGAGLNKVVYNGNGTSVTVTGLTAGVTYHVAIFEYNGTGPTQSYLSPGLTGSQATSTTYLTVTSGTVDWSDTAAWFDGSVPGVNDDVEIRTDVVLDVDAQVTDLDISAGSLSVNSAQTLTIANAGTFSNNGSFTDTAGTLVFSGDAAVSGSGSFTLNNLTINGGVEFPAGYVVNGILTLNANSFVQNNSPNYGPNSTLVYNSANSVATPYGRRSEWSNASPTAGQPVNVIVQNNTALDMGFDITNVEALITGDLTIDAGSSVLMNVGANDMTAALAVQGDFLNNGTLTLSDAVGGDLKVGGNYTQNGTLNNNGRAVFFDGAGAQTATGTTLPLTFDYLRIDKSGTTLVFEEDVVVTQVNGGVGFEQTDGIVTIAAGKSLTVENTSNFEIDAGSFTLESTSQTYSSLIVSNVTNNGGNIRYNRFTNAAGSGTTGGNDLVAAPLSGQRFDDFATANNGILTASNDLRAFAIFDNAANPGAFVNYDVVADAAVTLAAGVGYRAATDTGANLLFDGSVSTGDVNVAITSETGTFGVWNLIGNPYPSYISMADFLNHEETPGTPNIDLMLSTSAGIYGYDGAASDGWDVVNLANAGSRLMAPGQGFFVAASGNVSLQFTPAMRSTGSSDDFIVGRNSDDLTYLRLRAASGTKAYHTEIYFNDNASLGLDPGYDSKVLDINLPTFLLYSHLVEDSGLPIALQSVNTTDLNEVSIPLGVHANAGEAISFSLTENTLPGATEVYLEDTVAQTFTLLTSESYVVTPADNLNGTGRFFLRIGNDVLSNPDNELDRLHIYTLPDTRELVIAGVLNDATTAMVYDLQGREVYTQVLSTGVSSQSMDVSHLGTGVYIVTLDNANGRKTQKVILK